MLKRTRQGVIGCTALALAVLNIIAAPSASADTTTVVCTDNGCTLVATADAEYLGLVKPSGGGSGRSEGEGGGSNNGAPVCTYTNVDDKYTSDARFLAVSGGHSRSEGSIYTKSCYQDGGGNAIVDTIFVATTAGNPVEIMDPEVVAQDAISQVSKLSALVPDAHMFPEQLSVNRWTYLWVADPGAVSATATAGTVSVTATARLKSVTWSMGEPVDGRTFTCQGPGRDPGPDASTTMVEDPEPGSCTYAFHQRSLDERTGGSGVWQVTAQANWVVTWQSNTGASGSDTLQSASVSDASVGEWRTVIVPVDPNCCR
jgi:hypothetical protein